MRRIGLLIVFLLLALSLCGCGSIYDKEYVVISDYSAENQSAETEERVSVRNFSELRNALLNLVYAGNENGIIVFDAAYNGDVTEDIASACWRLRTQNALCAYCVENIAYELSQIVTYYEANIYVTYSPKTALPENIIHLNYTTELSELLSRQLEQGETRIVSIVSSALYDGSRVQQLLNQLFLADPCLSYYAPVCNVNVYSGNGMQKLYEISVDYGVDAETLLEYRTQAEEICLLENPEEMNRAFLQLCTYLTDHCRYEPEGKASAYAALLEGEADSQGLALAFKVLCNRYGITSEIVHGQKNWSDHYWNIVTLEGERYHVDVSSCVENGLDQGILFNDSAFWGIYRWNTGDYEACTGTLTDADLFLSENS